MKKLSIISSLLTLTIITNFFIGCNKNLTSQPNNHVNITAETQKSKLSECSNDSNTTHSKENQPLPSKEEVTPIFQKLLNDFLTSENDYIYHSKTSIDTLLTFLSSDANSLRDSYKEIEDRSKLTTERLYKQIGTRFDEIENIEILSPTTAHVQAKRYVEFSQTCRQGYSLRTADYDLILENNKWLIKDLKISNSYPYIKNCKLINNPNNNDKAVKAVEIFNNQCNPQNKIESIVQIVQYDDRILVTTLESNNFSKNILINYFVSPKTHEVILCKWLIFNDTNVKAIDDKDFNALSIKAKDILKAEKPIYNGDANFSNKNPIIASILVCNGEYIIGYYDEYKNSDGYMLYDFNTATFSSNNENLILKSNKNCFDD